MLGNYLKVGGEEMNKEQQAIYDEGYMGYSPCDPEENNPYSGMDAEYWSDGYADAEDDCSGT